ncbi:hypothetical protein [Alicyclobacillus ferrooxydans]|uniref:hypothetical protein n=1 Tax=Alicyclobacillus ferrooxydans TaxID=471514 RepID=UPI0012ED8F7C|nr:hypothetical protein [Alicyclobacillus ferrooxydans]
MNNEIELLGTASREQQPEVQQCILPLIVLFSIAAQENRATAGGARRMGRVSPIYPGMAPGFPPGRGVRRRVMVQQPAPGLYYGRRRIY